MLLFFAAVISAINIPTNAHANIANWNPGRIMDDGVFTNSSSMTTQQIQDFLNSKVPVCDTQGLRVSEFGGGTRAQWAAARGYSPPFTCLKDFSENGKSSAQIINDISKEFAINPQVLIVLLQKEQSLITDTWPIPGSSQYRTATGYGCPDTAPCDSQYYGLTNQLRWSARMFRAIVNGTPTWYTPYVLGNNYIQYNPVASCGGSTVTIQNRATQALYNYTPYQPNPGALASGWGTSPCGAYGNRNFYLYFTDWFGSTLTPAFSAQPTWQQVYSDPAHTTALGWNATLSAGQTAYASVVMKNTGNTTWTRQGAFTISDTRLATYAPWGKTSIFCDNSWTLGCSRPAALKEASVAPGQSGTFEFAIKAPLTAGTYTESFALVVDGRAVFNDGAMTFSIKVEQAVISAQPTWQQVYSNPTKTTALGWNATLSAGQTAYASVVMKNTGNTTWTKTGSFGLSDVRLVTHGPWGRSSALCDPSWIIDCTRPVDLKEASVAPGQSGTFEFAIKAPANPGRYSEAFGLVIDGRSVIEGNPVVLAINVESPNFSAQPTWQQVYSNPTKTTALGWNATLSAGQAAYASVVMKNTGNTTWTREGGFTTSDTRLATYSPWGRSSAFCDSTWVISCTRPAALKEASVAPGQSGTFEFAIKAPTKPGTYTEAFGLVIDGRTVFNAGTMGFVLTVQ